MKNAGNSLVAVLVAVSLSACAMETTPEPADEDGVVENQITPNDDALEPPGSLKCQPVLVYGDDGKLTVKEWLCPLPHRPLPDPAELQSKDGLREDWVSAGSHPPGAH